MMSFVVSPTSCVVLLLAGLHLAAVSCHLEQEEKEETGGWSVWEQGSGETDKSLELEPNLFPDEEEVNFYNANIEDFFEGDIILTPNQRKQIMGDIEAQQKEADDQEEEEEEEDEGRREHDIHERAVVRDSSYKWPNAVVPFVISSSLPSSHVAAIQSAMRTYQEETCIRFEPWSGQNNYVRFIRGRGCYSYIGRIGGAQDISIGDGCQNRGIVMHEIFHALGRWHEQSRPDRDSYITVNYNNIRDGLEGQFFKLRSSYANTNGVAYDYSSVMHYSAYAFSRNRQPTITPRNSRVSLSALGQRTGLSSRDYQHVRSLYCNQVSTPQWSSWSNWGRCSVSCGRGTQTRTRSCQGTGCSGSGTDTRSCGGPSCPGQWSNWSSWGGCSPSCGTNRARSRSRRCQGQGGCVGESTQRVSCADISCTVQRPQGGMSAWASWGPCSRLCEGYQFRRRTCLNSALGCSSPYYQLRRCNVGRCSSNQFDDHEEQQQQNPQQQDDDADAAVTKPISAGSATTSASLLLGCAMVTMATLMK